MILDGLWCCFRASSWSRYDAPEGRIQAVTRDISKMLEGWNFLKQSAANELSNWKMAVRLLHISLQTFSSFQLTVLVCGYGIPI